MSSSSSVKPSLIEPHPSDDDNPDVIVIGDPGGSNSPPPGGGGGGPGDPGDQPSEVIIYGEGVGSPDPSTSPYSRGNSGEGFTELIVNAQAASNFVHTAGLNALLYTAMDASQPGPYNEVGEVIIVARHAGGSPQFYLMGLYIGPSVSQTSYGSVTLYTNSDNYIATHNLHTHKDGDPPSNHDIQQVADNLRTDSSSWSIISTKSGDVLVSGTAGLSDFGLSTSSPGVVDVSGGKGTIWEVTLISGQDEGWRI